MSSTSRRAFLRGSLALAGVGLLAGCGPPPSPEKSPETPRIGILGNFPSQQWDAFRAGLSELGYVEGQSIALEARWTEGIRDRFPSLAAELVALGVDLVVASSNPAVQAVMRAGETIPIVSPNLTFPVWNGLAASLAHPGGNVTGLSFLGVELDPKRLELLKEAFPGVRRVAYLADSPAMIGNPELRDAAATSGLELRGLPARDAAELEVALREVAGGQVDALLVSVSPILQLHRERVLAAVATGRLPAMYPVEEYVRDGGLMFYGPNQPELFRRAAGYVDRILRGAKPGDLPIEQPTTFDFVVNLKAAQALGLTIPPATMSQATELIQ